MRPRFFAAQGTKPMFERFIDHERIGYGGSHLDTLSSGMATWLTSLRGIKDTEQSEWLALVHTFINARNAIACWHSCLNLTSQTIFQLYMYEDGQVSFEIAVHKVPLVFPTKR
jgi:hypothetical protein